MSEGEFLEAHAPQVYNLALRLTGNASDAEDLAQDALIRALKHDRGVDYDAVGPDVHFAAKVEERAPRNAAMMSGETLALAGASVVGASQGDLSVGPARVLALFELKAISFDPDIDRLLDQDASVRFVGREKTFRYLIDKIGAATPPAAGMPSARWPDDPPPPPRRHGAGAAWP